MKVIVSDTQLSHGNTMKSLIQSWVPDATIDVRVESIESSLNYAIINGYHIINRSTSGLSDSRIETVGDVAYSSSIQVVHALGSNSYFFSTNPTKIGSIIVARTVNTSYGNGVEFTTTESNQSNSTAIICGMISKIVHEISCSFDEARQRLRESCNNWNSGWNYLTGYGIPNFNQAYSSSAQYELATITKIIAQSWFYKSIFSWESLLNKNHVIVIFNNKPNLDTPISSGSLIYAGMDTNYLYNNNLDGDYYYGFYNSGSKTSRLDTYSTGSINFKNKVRIKGSGVTIIKGTGITNIY